MLPPYHADRETLLQASEEQPYKFRPTFSTMQNNMSRESTSLACIPLSSALLCFATLLQEPLSFCCHHLCTRSVITPTHDCRLIKGASDQQRLSSLLLCLMSSILFSSWQLLFFETSRAHGLLSFNLAGNPYGNMSAGLSSQTLLPAQMYPQMQASTMHHEHTTGAVDNITETFGNINLRNAAYMGHGKAGNGPMIINDPNMNAMMSPQTGGQMVVQLADGSFVYTGSNNTQGNYHQYSDAYNMAATHPTHYQQGIYRAASHAGIQNGPHTPRNNAWNPSQGIQQLPELVAPRRSSWSSNEEQSPQTPLDGYQQAVMISGQSPTTWSTTPSPGIARFPYNTQVRKTPGGEYEYADFWAWTQQTPAIPPPIPAIHSGQDGGRGSLDKILDNRNGTTNVYIRGLQPNTDDAMLEGYGRRFGDISSQKAIIDMTNGTCKG